MSEAKKSFSTLQSSRQKLIKAAARKETQDKISEFLEAALLPPESVEDVCIALARGTALIFQEILNLLVVISLTFTSWNKIFKLQLLEVNLTLIDSVQILRFPFL